MAIAYVQSANSGVPVGTASSKAAAFVSAQTAHNANIIIVSWGESAATSSSKTASVSDSSGNVYYPAPPGIASCHNATQCLLNQVFYCPNIVAAGAGANTVTATLSAAANYAYISILEYSGLSRSQQIDLCSSKAVNGPGATTAIAGTSVTPSNASALVFGAISCLDGIASAGTGYTSRDNTYTTLAEEKIVSSVAAQAASATAAAGGNGWTSQTIILTIAPAYTVPPRTAGSARSSPQLYRGLSW